jgi:hypothetical protein
MSMTPTQKAALKRLRKQYGYDLAEARQNHQLTPEEGQEELEVLALLHLSTGIVGAVNEYIDTVGDDPPMLAAIMSALMAHAGETAKILDSVVGLTDYTDMTIKSAMAHFSKRRGPQ